MNRKFLVLGKWKRIKKIGEKLEMQIEAIMTRPRVLWKVSYEKYGAKKIRKINKNTMNNSTIPLAIE